MSKIIVIDGTSTSFGGGLTHLIEFLNEGLESEYCFEIIISKKIESHIPKSKNIKTITHILLDKTLIHRYFFKFFLLDRYINKKAYALISLSGDYLGRFRPFIGMCQNMLLYEKKKRSGMYFLERLKFEIQKYVQVKSFIKSDGIIFLSNHAKGIVSSLVGYKKMRVINFGISKRFINESRKLDNTKVFSLLYVSSIHTYKNQLNLLIAVKSLLEDGVKINLTLVGPILNKSYWIKVEKVIKEINSKSKCVNYLKYVNYNEMHKIYNDHSVFVFPSICENMPNILLEACASKIPIISSNEAPMPEFMEDNAVYFNPMDINSIKERILYSLNNFEIIQENSIRAFLNLKKYTWKKNFDNTIELINEIKNDV
jgi:glycosyltransferase involved in cell wall biosynthesis